MKNIFQKVGLGLLIVAGIFATNFGGMCFFEGFPKAWADTSGLVADLVANKADLMQIYTSAGAGPQQVNWETMVRSVVGAVNWSAIVTSNNSVNWAQVILPTAP